jgi:SAM-dependent methyltransferase
MIALNKTIQPFETYTAEYDEWYKKYPYVFKSEVEAIRNMLPAGESHGIEVGLGTGRFSVALGIKEGVEPSFAMRKMAIARGVEVMDSIAERLPYKSLHFDFVLMSSCVSYFFNVHAAFCEAHRVLKRKGSLVIGFVDKNSIIGNFYEAKKANSIFYKHATFYSVPQIVAELREAGFKELEFSQTLFHNLDEIKEFEPAIEGYGNGSFVVIKAIKK